MTQNFITKLSLLCLLCVYGTQTEAAEKLAKNQVLNLGTGAEVPTLDPQKEEDTASARVDNDLFEGLVMESEDGTKILPGIASHYEISSDGLTYTFHIRPDADFSDGSKMTADDVVFSFRRLVDPKVASAYSFIASDIVGALEVNSGKKPLDQLGVKAIDANTVQIKLTQPVPYFIKILVLPNFSVLKKEAVEKFGNAFELILFSVAEL